MSNNPGSEKNYWLALGLSALVLLGWPWFLNKLYPNRQAAAPKTQQVQQAPSVTELAQTVKAAIPEIKAETINYSNRIYDIRFSNLGAGITQLLYKGESAKTHLEEVPFYLGPETEPGIFAARILHDDTDASRVLYRLNRKSDSVFEFIYEKPGQYRLTKQYTVEEERPVILLDITFENLSAGEKNFPLELDYGLYYADTHEAAHHDVETVFFQDKSKSEKLNKIQKKGFSFGGDNLEWCGAVKKYFALLMKTDWKIIAGQNTADDKMLSGTLKMEPVTVAAGGQAKKRVFIYAGPQRYETLKHLDMGFEEILSKGFFGLFKIWLLIALKFLNQFTHNFGWAIILLTLGLKLLFTPMTHMSYESMRKMQAIQPKMKAIQERYKKDPQKMNREVMELYRRNKVNPMGGCLPMLAQIPIFIAFYQVLNETIELKGASFIGWIHDLAAPDRLIHFSSSLPVIGDSFNLLPLFMIGSMIWQQKLTPQPASSPEQAQVMQFMPLMMGVLFYRMPAGLVLYWFVNNMLTVFHQLVIKRMGAVVLHHEDRDN